MRVFVLTNQGWMNEDDIFTPETKKIKKSTKAMPIEVNEELTENILNEFPMAVIRRGYYYIISV